MNPLRSVRGRLALALLVVVAGALGIVYVIVVPTTKSSLIDTRVNGLEKNLTNIVADVPPIYLSPEWVRQEVVPLADARVVVFRRLRNGQLSAISDSSPPHGSSRDVRDDRIASQALSGYVVCSKQQEGQCLESGTVTRDGVVYAEAAYPLTQFVVVLLTAPLSPELAAVTSVRDRMLIAGGIATVFALVLGYALATLFARRIGRLDAAAARIADGEFGSPIVDTDPDELGQLARTFERMRVRLASLDRARAEFIANASHELRTPLFSLAGFLELLASEELDAETRTDFMVAIRSQVTRLTKLATDLLDLSKLDAGRLSVAVESIDLAALGELLATEFGPRVTTSGHELDLNGADAAIALGDEERVLQIGRILIENAIVHTPPGTHIHVAAAADARFARLSVSDDGPGIERDAQGHIFDRFYRLDRSVASGSGLGLAIARELVTLMGGRLELISVPGSTRFTIVLPLDTAGRSAVEERTPLLSKQ
jgi:signal transduction histidine kinase